MERFHADFLSNPHLENLSSVSNLTHDLLAVVDGNTLNWPVLALSLLVLSGTLGNLLVCVSIAFDKQLQTVTNWFLFSLAIADCLVSLIVLPLSIIKDFQGKNERTYQSVVVRCSKPSSGTTTTTTTMISSLL